jgi:hypothetical protein
MFSWEYPFKTEGSAEEEYDDGDLMQPEHFLEPFVKMEVMDEEQNQSSSFQ